MRSSRIAIVFIALVFSSTASAVAVYEAYMGKDGKVTERKINLFDRGTYASIVNGQAEVVIKNLNKGPDCNVEVVDKRTKRIIDSTCIKVFETMKMIKQKYGGQGMTLPTTPAASEKLKSIAERTIGGVKSECFRNKIETICVSDLLGCNKVDKEVNREKYEKYFESMGNGMSGKDPEQAAHQALKKRGDIKACSYITSYKSWLNVKGIPGLHAMPKHVQDNFCQSLKDQGFMPPGWEVTGVTNERPKIVLPSWPRIGIAEAMQIPGAPKKANQQVMKQSSEGGASAKPKSPETPDMNAIKKQLEKFGIKGIEIPKSQ